MFKNNSRTGITNNVSGIKYFSTDTIKPIQTNTGNPVITNYSLGYTDQQVWAISQDSYGQMFFAHRQGIILFNGNDWEQIKLPAIPFTLKPVPELDLVLIGCDNDYGYIKKNNTGVYNYHSLKEPEVSPGEITDIKVTDTSIYFYSEESLIRHKKNSFEHDKSWYVKDGIPQNGIFKFNNDIYVSKKSKGVYKFVDGKKEFVPRSRGFSAHEITFDISLTDKKILLGNFGNQLYTFDGKRLRNYTTNSNKYLNESQLIGGVDLSENLFALSTISGGSLILNKRNGKIVSIINYQNGLPDDEIYAIGNDMQGGLWLSHGFGISRVNYTLPVRDYNYYPGIEGKLIDIINFDKTTYISTTEGVFYLDTIEDIKEIDILVKKQWYQFGKSETLEDDQVKKSDDKPESAKKKSVFQKWKEKRENRRIKKRTINNRQGEKKKTNKTLPGSTRKKKRLQKRVRYKKEKGTVLSLSYIFKKVEGINGKCKQLLINDNNLLVATNNGLYEIIERKPVSVLENVYVNLIVASKRKAVYYIGTDKGLTSVKKLGEKWREYPKVQPGELNESVYSIVEDEDFNLWVGGDDLIYYLNIDKNLAASSFEAYDFGKDYLDKFSIRQIGNKTFFLSSRQIFRFNSYLNKIEPNKKLLPNSMPFYRYIISQPSITWLQNENEWVYISDRYQLSPEQISLLNLFENIQNIKVDGENNIWVIDGNNKLFKILASGGNSYKEDFKVYLQEVRNDHGNLVSLNNIEIGPEINSLAFNISAPFYLKPDKIEYQYFIKGIMNGWSEWRQTKEFDFFVKPGIYRIQVRAKNIFGVVNSSQEYVIRIKTPIWLKTWFVLACIVASILFITLLVILILKKRERKLHKANKILEAKVIERTEEISKQKAQIESKNREITDSLNYASQIQSAIIPPLKILEDSIDEYFVFNKPKDIVSGDYYWVSRVNGQLLVTAADCTGHGVPGAFLSMLGVTFLNEITHKMDELRPNLILNKLRERVIDSMHHDGHRNKRFDGIDLSLVVIDLNRLKLQFSGANNPMYLIRKGFLTEFKGNKMPIGIHSHSDRPFTNHEIEAKKGDVIYMFSDGFTDQFGGELGRKFLTRNFKALLIEICDLPLKEQKKIIQNTFELWKGDYEQIDDILIVGLRI